MDVVSKVREGSTRYPDFLAVIDGEWRCTHAELWDRVDRLSQGLLGLGVSKGDVVLAWLPNAHEAIESELACLQIGIIWVTLNTQMIWNEVRNVITDTDPKIMIVGPDQYDQIDIADPRNPPSFEDTLKIVTGDLDSILSYESLISANPAKRPVVDVVESDIARLRYTSGTTGAMKAAVLSHQAYLASLQNHQNELHAMDPSDRVLHVAPLTHASGSYLYPVLAAGGANVIARRFDAEEILETIERERITTMFVVPTILQRLSASPRFRTRDLSSLRTVAYGGAPMSVEKLTPAIEGLGTALLQIYGLTEALHPVTTLKREEHWVGNPNLDSIGTPTAINQVKLVDKSGAEIHDERVGELHVRGANVMDGYWNAPEATDEVLKDGWLATGDLGYRDQNGYFRIVDRKKDVIISGGFNVYTAEVESVLNDHPAVTEAAVIGIPHDEWGESVHAIVVCTPGSKLTPDDLVAHCRSRLSKFKVPKNVSFHDGPLPKSGAGKILKQELRRPFWEDQKRQVH
ncbi:MAG: AMP-binding protein [Candidatus Hydrogenedentes bacterium]|nr:AMP-binding protein [Candidatus Hydrogenedentota bacterium]